MCVTRRKSLATQQQIELSPCAPLKDLVGLLKASNGRMELSFGKVEVKLNQEVSQAF